MAGHVGAQSSHSLRSDKTEKRTLVGVSPELSAPPLGPKALHPLIYHVVPYTRISQ